MYKYDIVRLTDSKLAILGEKNGGMLWQIMEITNR